MSLAMLAQAYVNRRLIRGLGKLYDVVDLSYNALSAKYTTDLGLLYLVPRNVFFHVKPTRLLQGW